MMRYTDDYDQMRQLKVKRRRRQLMIRVVTLLVVTVAAGVGMMKLLAIGPFNDEYAELELEKMDLEQPELDIQLLTVNPYSRPGTHSGKINNIVIHYTANPGTTAMQNRNYFEGLKDSRATKASSHFIIGLDGEIIQCVPTWEIAFASNNRNGDTVSIETCHPKEDGAYTKETYKSLIQLTAWLCEKFELTEKDVIRHYDITGKICPKYFVDHEDKWEEFRENVGKVMKEK